MSVDEQAYAEFASVAAMGRALATHVFCVPALVPDLPEALPPGQ